MTEPDLNDFLMAPPSQAAPPIRESLVHWLSTFTTTSESFLRAAGLTAKEFQVVQLLSVANAYALSEGMNWARIEEMARAAWNTFAESMQRGKAS